MGLGYKLSGDSIFRQRARDDGHHLIVNPYGQSASDFLRPALLLTGVWRQRVVPCANDVSSKHSDRGLPRAEALTAINEALRAGRDRLLERGFQVQAVSTGDMGETKLLVQRDDLFAKIEVNTVIRGTVHPTQMMSLIPAASDALMADLELPLLSPKEIYGGRLVAAMDRQHPRDLFDHSAELLAAVHEHAVDRHGAVCARRRHAGDQTRFLGVSRQP